MDALQIMGVVVGMVGVFAAIFQLLEMRKSVKEMESEVENLQQRVKQLRSK